MKAKNEVYGQKERVETQLTNQDRLNNQGVYRENVGILRNNDMLSFQRKNQIQGDVSRNAANFVEDARIQITEENLRNRDMATIELLKRKYQDKGIWDRNVQEDLDKFVRQEITYEEFQRRVAAAEAKKAKPSYQELGKLAASNGLDTSLLGYLDVLP